MNHTDFLNHSSQYLFEDGLMRILLVEDEPEMSETLRRVLEREKFVVDCANSLKDAELFALSGQHELILLDRTLPDGDGIDLMPKFRSSNPGVPIIVLSARGTLSDRIDGLDEGADDYLAKPFALEELLARIRAIRRRPKEISSEELTLGRLTFDLTSEEVSVDGVRMELSRRELRVLSALLKRQKRTVLRETLEQAVYGFDDEIQSNSLDSHISRLRRKLQDANANLEIHAVRGVGYLLREAS
jgi:DNA-binding response OmpR family regulator